MQTTAAGDHDGLRRAAWIASWILLALLAFVVLVALGHLLRNIGGTLLFSLGGFGAYAGFLRVAATVFVVAGAILLPIALVVRLVHALRAKASGGRLGGFWPAFDIPLLVLAGLVVLTWSALALPDGRWPRQGLLTPGGSLFYLGLALLAGGTVIFLTDPRLRAASTASAGSTDAAAKGRKSREGSHLGAFTLGALFIIIASLGLLDALGVVNIDPLTYPALILTVLAAGMFVGTWVGRARWLTILCVLTLPFVAAANVIGVSLTGGIGDVSYSPSSAAEVESTYHLGVGDLTLDLTALHDTPVNATTSVSLAAGTVRIYVPGGTKVVVDTSVRAGEILVTRMTKNGIGYGSGDSGFDLADTSTFGADSPGLLQVMVDCGLCSVNISSENAGDASGKDSGAKRQKPDARPNKEKS